MSSQGESVWKRPESVLIIVSARNGRLLVMERCSPRGFWQSVTGRLKLGETPGSAAKRELYEETGLGCEKLRDTHMTYRFPIVMPWRQSYPPGITSNLEHVFQVTLPCPSRIYLNRREHVRYRWLPQREALHLIRSWSNRAAIRRRTGCRA